MVRCGQGPFWSIIAAMNSADSQFKLRLPTPLKEELERAAVRAGRSLSAEIVHRLQRSTSAASGAPGAMGLRAEIAGQRELAQITVEMLRRSVEDLEAMSQGSDPVNYPGRADGASAAQSLADARSALEVFSEIVDSATLLLSEIAIAEARGKPIDPETILERAIEAGVLTR